jgi:hypothetical protein
LTRDKKNNEGQTAAIGEIIRNGMLFPSVIESMPGHCSRPSNKAVSDVLKLANALSALYPKESEEKRSLEAML